MASWDTAHSLKALLDSYSEATGHTYVLIIAQGDDTTPRVIAHASAGFPETAGPHTLFELEAAAAGIFDEIAEHLGIFDEGDDEGEPQA